MSFKKEILWLLFPFSCLYGLGVNIRNFLFDKGILKSVGFDIPIICVGNITIGGTGKTPHTEYLIQLLTKHHRVAVLSRGYKRKKKGFLIAHAESTAHDIGDEPYQIKKKFPDITVAVCTQRVKGVRKLLDLEDSISPDVILLDDAFQHRHIKAGLNILLTDYHHLINNDRFLPTGRLRDSFRSRKRADIVIVSKCPEHLSPAEMSDIKEGLRIFPHQKLFFSTLKYGNLLGAWSDVKREMSTITPNTKVFLLTGIANPRPILDVIKETGAEITSICYPDHHNFSSIDVKHINKIFHHLSESGDAILITTEKDASRLLLCQGLSESVQRHLYILPVRIAFLNHQEDEFNSTISHYVRTEHSGSRSVAERKIS